MTEGNEIRCGTTPSPKTSKPNIVHPVMSQEQASLIQEDVATFFNELIRPSWVSCSTEINIEDYGKDK